MSDFDKDLLDLLIQKELDGVLADQEFDQLESILKHDDSAIRYYSKNMVLCSLFQGYDSLELFSTTAREKTEEVLDINSVMRSMAKNEQLAETVEDESKVAEDLNLCPKASKKIRFKKLDKFNKVFNSIAVLAAVLMFMFIVYANIYPPKYSVSVARVVDQVGVVWDDNSATVKNNDRLMTNQLPFVIKEGVLEILYDNGVDVFIEGPAEFRIGSRDIFVSYGRVFSKVSEKGLGFAIESPFVQFVDLGTEFGVDVERGGVSELHVIDGQVRFYASIGDECVSKKIVYEQSALRFCPKSGVTDYIEYMGEKYARRINSETGIVWRGQQKVDLADIVGGGDGFGTGRLNYGINYQGETIELRQLAVQTKIKEFVQILSNRFVDGVFIPNGSTCIDSAGTVYSGFETTNNRYYLGVLNGAWHQNKDESVPRHLLRLGGKIYGSHDNPAIYIHANQGITFDLDAIRNYTDMKIVRLIAYCGMSDTYLDYATEMRKVRNHYIEKPQASFYVIIDGKERIVRKDITYLDGEIAIEVELGQNDRFLTLATTQGSDGGNDGDWIFFAAPKLDLEQ